MCRGLFFVTLDKAAMVYPGGSVFWSRPCIVAALCSFDTLS